MKPRWGEQFFCAYCQREVPGRPTAIYRVRITEWTLCSRCALSGREWSAALEAAHDGRKKQGDP